MRHGESQWNLENRFTGWTEVELTPKGEQEAHLAAKKLLEHDFNFDLALTSVLNRAIKTLWIVMEVMDVCWVPVERDWRLNERHYGALQGLNKAETAERLGQDVVHAWRRSYAARPPALDWDDPRHPRFDSRYAQLDPAVLPASESLADTLERVLPFWNERVIPCLLAGHRPIIVAHGNSLRALVKHIDKIPDDQIPDLNIPTGVPLIYALDENLRICERRYLT